MAVARHHLMKIIRTWVCIFSLTLGIAFILAGISWLQEFGCAVACASLQFSGCFAAAPLNARRSNSFVGRLGVLVGTGGGIWQLSQMLAVGHVWTRVAPPEYFVVFILIIWLGAVVGIVRKKGVDAPAS